MKFILLLGAPGAGKGSIAEYLAQTYRFVHLSTGHIFRSLGSSTKPIAQKIRAITSEGKLVPDDLTNDLIFETLTNLAQEHPEQTVILDGYPRTISQAEFFNKHFLFDHVLLLEVSEAEILFRLNNRLVCTQGDHTYHKVNKPPHQPGICDVDQTLLYQRKDDQADVILHRLEVYQQQTTPLIELYEQLGLLTRIDAGGSLASTETAVISILGLSQKK
ncbi:adenylate kinase [Mycoplasmoides fastidiosum]|uniref:Adenylate kinase n=1 Tax=Mycoplasmoides fastidiosum TaxID=92758 RepID=A0ABU0LY41_9BACT|nr:nucleoside monophosphate kinase [Mycoplasmoides fastidiosum]MDQ0513614.1 adenylate kinase [Mycoplasmoides fastidiosum]UUD37963.1 nucleoside monophosphate kinase [Mycoplasmoides fastidiosum]